MEGVFTHPVTIFAAGLLVGFISGVLAQRKLCTDHEGETSREIGAWVLVTLISALYSASVVASIVNQGYSTPIALHGIMGLVVGYALETKVGDVIKAIRS